ncbi:MAG: radical SAM protein [Desulfobulbaceae bacterium]|uniref:Radical SAM protein n=1 Tax=Candidatus Desulfatifera sulfidica TaxID=2841691 RepID=A0A8J6T970_9BACT|nr:radical SAM protein [Candidatus Desulfatifera sulfidica]
MKYLFGPVYSRRLGHSLGIDLLPPKICTFNCVYCEVGPTTEATCERREYVPTEEIIAEIDEVLASQAGGKPIDVFTLTAMGEPTLHSGLGAIIDHIKANSDKPVAVLTNGTLFFDPQVRRDLQNADIVIPSLDSARQESFERVNQPAVCIKLAEVIEGLICFRKEFYGKIWLEILLVRGMNDSLLDLQALRDVVARINPERIQLNTVARPPMDSTAGPVTQAKMNEAQDILSEQYQGQIDILVDFQGTNMMKGSRKEELLDELANDIEAMLQRRPCTIEEIDKALDIRNRERTKKCIDMLVSAGRIEKRIHNNREFYQ